MFTVSELQGVWCFATSSAETLYEILDVEAQSSDLVPPGLEIERKKTFLTCFFDSVHIELEEDVLKVADARAMALGGCGSTYEAMPNPAFGLVSVHVVHFTMLLAEGRRRHLNDAQ